MGDWGNIVPVYSIEQLTTELLDESLVKSNTYSQAQCTSEHQRNYIAKIKVILSSLEFKFIFFLIIFLIPIIHPYKPLTKNSIDLTPKSLDLNFKIPGYSIPIDYLVGKLVNLVYTVDIY